MPTFEVRVRDHAGNIRTETVRADSAERARQSLQNQYPTIGRARRTGGGASWDLSQLQERLATVGVKDKAVFSRQFAAMVNAGVGIVRCLSVLAEETSNPKLKKALIAISADVQQGTSLSEAMRKHPACFDRLYISMVEAGEVGGVLDEVLDRLARLLEEVARLQGQIKSAMAYPVTVGVFAVLVFFGMTIFLIPMFAEIFQGLGVELPMLTQLMLAISVTLRSWVIVFPLGAAIATVVAFRQYYQTPNGRVQIDRLMLKLPLLGELNVKNAVARFSRVFGTLTRSGVPILTALDIVGETSGNQVIANATARSKQEIQQGVWSTGRCSARTSFPDWPFK